MPDFLTRIILLLSCCLLPIVAATVLELNPVACAWLPVAGNERGTGQLPAGWYDNSGWGHTWVAYARGDDRGDARGDARGNEAGRTFLHMAVSRSDDGRAQVTHALPELTEPGIWLIRATLRSSSRAQVELGIRDQGAPYAFTWETQVTLGPAWSAHVWTVRIERHAQAVGFFCNLSGLGSVDIAALTCERWTHAEYIALQGDADKGGPVNRLRITRAPLGLPPGWMLDREASDGDVVQITNDAAVVGVGGGPALKLTSPIDTSLHAGCFTAPAGVPQVASIRVRGAGHLTLTVMGDGRELAKKETALTDDWQVVQATFDPVLLATSHHLTIGWKGTLWLDTLQVERGAKATDFTPPAVCELALQHASPGRLQFTPQVEVMWRVVGPWSGAILVAEVVDAYGRHQSLPPQPLTSATGTLVGTALNDLPFGPLRIEARVVKDGADLSLATEIVVYRLPQPRHWGEDATESAFGVHTNSTTRHNLMAKAIGANWVRGHDAGQYTTWMQLEPQRGQWVFRDADINRYRQQHLKMLGLLSTAPGWASYLGEPRTGYFDQYFQPKDLAAWSTYVQKVTSHYHGVIDAWEVWNEPWLDMFWHIGRDEPAQRWIRSPTAGADYARIQELAFRSAKAVDPSLTILGFNTTAFGTDWTTAVRDAGGLATCDVVSYHHYEGNPEAMAEDVMSRGWQSALSPVFNPEGRPLKPVWISEGSPLTNFGGHGLYRLTVPESDPEDMLATGDRCARWLVSLLARDVRKVFIYSMHSHDYFQSKSEWRALVDGDGYLHPSASAYAACAWHLDDTHPISITVPVAGITAFAFQGLKRAVVVLAPQPDHAPFLIPAGVIAADVLGNPLPAGSSVSSTVVYASAPGQVADLLAHLK